MMPFLGTVLNILQGEMEQPGMYGWFHLLWFGLSILAGILLCVFLKDGTERQVRAVVLTVTVIVAVLEIYKQIVYTFSYTDGTFTTDYQWYIFPWQFCSIPMYVGLLAGLTPKGRIHEASCSFLATYAMFAGLCVMLYPNTVFIDWIGVNIQTMFCHGSMLTVGIYLLYTGYVKRSHRTILKAIPVFAAAVGVAVVLNEIFFHTSLTGGEEVNLFFISPHAEPSLPVYSLVQAVVPYPWCLVIYIAAFSLAAYLILLISMGVERLFARASARV